MANKFTTYISNIILIYNKFTIISNYLFAHYFQLYNNISNSSSFYSVYFFKFKLLTPEISFLRMRNLFLNVFFVHFRNV